MKQENAQKIIRRDPDLMTVMQINIEDSDITNTTAATNKKKEEPKKPTEKKEEKKEDKKTQDKPKPAQQPALKPKDDKKKTYGNLFG